MPAGHSPPVAFRPSIDRLNEAAGPDAPAGDRVDGKAESQVTAPTPPPPKEKIVIREATAADVERMEKLALSDYLTDFSKLGLPVHEGPITREEMGGGVGRFVGLVGQAGEA